MGFRDAAELLRQDFSVGHTLVFELEKESRVWLRFVPDASRRCALLLPSGETLRLPGEDGKMHAQRVFPPGEVRIVVGDGDGELIVSREAPPSSASSASAGPVAPPAEFTPCPAPGWNVRDFGAAGDGSASDTAAIQKALDAGGTVYVPPGVYRTGTLYLRSNGGLTLAPGARLKASPDRADYNAPGFCPQNSVCAAEKTNGAHLIVALECENVHLDGCGVIDGNRPAFFDPDIVGSRNNYTSTRPSQMIFFCESRNIRIENLTFADSPYWSCYLHGCLDAKIDGVRIDNRPRNSWNGDGIAIDCCKNVTVSNCIVRASDDCLTIRASGAGRLLRRSDGVCENILVSNCVLMKGHCGVRIGVGSGLIRSCAVSNCSVKDCWFGIGIHSSYQGAGGTEGADVENIVVNNITVDGGAPFYIADIAPVGAAKPFVPESGKEIRNISISNLRARANWNACLIGAGNRNLSGLSLTDIFIETTGGDMILTDPPLAERSGMDLFRFPYAVFAANIRDSVFRNLRVVRHRHASGLWRAGLRMENCVRVETAPRGAEAFSECAPVREN